MIGRKLLTYKRKPCDRGHRPRRWPRLRHRAALGLQLGSFVQIEINVNEVKHRSVYQKLVPIVEEPTYIGRGAAAPRPSKMMKRHAPRGFHAARRTKGPSMQEIDRRRGFRLWRSKGRGPGFGFIRGGRRRREGNRWSGLKGPLLGRLLMEPDHYLNPNPIRSVMGWDFVIEMYTGWALRRLRCFLLYWNVSLLFF